MTKRTLNTRERFQLQTLVRDEYANKGMTDAEFAAFAVETLHLPGINANHVDAARRDFDIPSTKAVRIARDNGLEARVTRIEEWINQTFGKEGLK